MELRRKIAQNTAIQTSGKLLGMILSLFAAGIVFRILGDSGFGQYTSIMGYLQIFGTLMDFGLYIILIKKIATVDERSSPIVNTIFTMRVVSGLIFLGSAPLLAMAINLFTPVYSAQLIYGMLLALGFFFFISLNQLLSVIFQKQLQSNRIALGEFVGKIVLLAATVTVGWLHLGLYAILLTMVLSSGVNCLILFIASRKFVHLRFAWNTSIVKTVLREVWPIALSIVFVQLYFKGDIVFLTFFHTSDAAIGWYGAPYKMLEVLITFPTMFIGLALPTITAAWQQKDLLRFQRVMQKSFDALVLMAIPLIGGTVVLAPHIMQLLAGEDFSNSTGILRILIIATAAIFIATLFGYVVVAVNKQRQMMYGYGFVAASAIALYLYTIPRFGITGAAWVTVYSEVAIMLITTWMVLRTTHVRLHLWTVLKAAVATAGMYVVLTWVTQPITQFADTIALGLSAGWLAALHLLILVPIGMAVYAALALLFRAVRFSEMKDLIRSQS